MTEQRMTPKEFATYLLKDELEVMSMNRQKALKHLQKARELSLKCQLSAGESYPDFALDFSRIGKEIDRALEAMFTDEIQPE
jgi:hypothetical protein